MERNFKAQYLAIFFTMLGYGALTAEIALPVWPLWPWLTCAVISAVSLIVAVSYIRKI